MEWQLNALSNQWLLSRFLGMVTDSRSFMSYPRHEYFRRVLCNLLGRDVEKGEIPDDEMLLGPMLRNICYGNAQRYLALPADDAPGETCKKTVARFNGQPAVKRIKQEVDD
jgi:glucuronate isomerase